MNRPRIIINPASARGRTKRRLEGLGNRLRPTLGKVDLVLTRRPGHASRLAAEALRDGAELVIAVGGDGTISEVVNGFFDAGNPINPDATLGVISSGTGGDFRRSHPIPATLDGQLEVLAAGRVRCIDLGLASFVDHTGEPAERYFANSASAGLSGRVCQMVNRARFSKLLGGRLAFRLASLRGLMSYRNQPLRLQHPDGRTEEATVNTLAVCNGRFFGGGMEIAPAARCDDGLLDVILLGDLSRRDAVSSMPMLYRGTHLAHPKVRASRTRRLRLEPVRAEPVLIEVDGEGPGRLPADFRVVPGALRLLVGEGGGRGP